MSAGRRACRVHPSHPAGSGTAFSVIHTSELPNRPRPARPDSARPSSFAGSAWPGGGNRPARSSDTAVASSAAEIRRSAKASDSATGGASDVGTARSGDRYIVQLFPDHLSPHTDIGIQRLIDVVVMAGHAQMTDLCKPPVVVQLRVVDQDMAAA